MRSNETYRRLTRHTIGLVLTLIYVASFAQTSHTKTTFDNGSGTTSGSTVSTRVSIGLPFVGTASSTNHNLSAGFISETVEALASASIVQESIPRFYELGTGGLTLSVTVNDENLVNQVAIEFRKLSSPSDTPTQQTITSDGSNNYSVTIPDAAFGDDIGLIYNFTVSSLNGAEVERADITYLAVTAGSEPIPNLSFGSSVSNYQIISIPYELDNRSVLNVFDELAPYDNTKWRFFTYLNGQTTEFGAFTNIDVGRGYWLIVADQTTISIGAGNLPTATPTSPFEITLEPGWNQIGNPYTYTIDWNGILQHNGNPTGISDLFQLAGSTLGTNNTLATFRGGFVENTNSSAVVIQLPLDRSAIGGRLGGRLSDEPANHIDAVEWSVGLSISDGEFSNRLGGIGMHPNASPMQDHYDISLFPAPFEMAEIKFDVNGKNLSRNIVPPASGFVWEFEITEASNTVELTWDNSYFGTNEMNLILLDLDAGRKINMRETDSYSIASTEPRNFKIAYGTLDFIEENTLPSNFGLGDLYPNPFYSELNIPLTIKGSREGKYAIDIGIHDLSGRKMTNVWSGDLRPGFHEIKWRRDLNTIQMPTGVYYIVMTVAENGDDSILTKKIILK